MLYVITAVHNRYAITKEFVRQLKNQTYKEYTLVLVDDGSTDNTDKMVKEELPNSIVLYGDGNLWWGGALHKAYKYLSKIIEDNDIIYMSNDDITFKEDFLAKGVECLYKNPKYLVYAKGINDKTGIIDDVVQYRDVKTAEGINLDDEVPGNCCATRSLFMTGKAYKEIGGMHPILLPHYRSDIEYTIRAARKGHPCISYKELTYILHSESTGDVKAVSFRKKFSKRYYNNPIYNFTFIMLVTPLHILPIYVWNLFRRKIK